MALFKRTSVNGRDYYYDMWHFLTHRRNRRDELCQGDGSTTSFSETLNVELYDVDSTGGYEKIKASTVRILYTVGGVEYETRDDGSGNFQTTSTMSSAANIDTGTSSTIDYTTGAVSLTFSTAPDNGTKIYAIYEIDRDDDYGEVDGDVELWRYEAGQGDGSTTSFTKTIKLENTEATTHGVVTAIWWNSGTRYEDTTVATFSGYDVTLTLPSAPDDKTTVSINVDANDSDDPYLVVSLDDGGTTQYLLIDGKGTDYYSGTTDYMRANITALSTSYTAGSAWTTNQAVITPFTPDGDTTYPTLISQLDMSVYIWIQTKSDYSSSGTIWKSYSFSSHFDVTESSTHYYAILALEYNADKYYSDGQSDVYLVTYQHTSTLHNGTTGWKYYTSVRSSRFDGTGGDANGLNWLSHPYITQTGALGGYGYYWHGLDAIYEAIKSTADGKVYQYSPMLFNDYDELIPISTLKSLIQINSGGNLADGDEILTTHSSGKVIRHLVHLTTSWNWGVRIA